MKNSKHNDHQRPLSRDELKDRLSSENADHLDDFDREALEGWKKTGASFKVMSGLDRKYGGMKWFAVLGGLTLIVLISTVLFFALQNKEPKTQQTPHAKLDTNRVEISDYQLPPAIDTLNLIVAHQVIKAQVVASENKQMNLLTEVKKEEKKLNRLQIDELPPAKLPDLDKPKAPAKKALFHAQEIYAYDLKLVDYRLYRSRPKIKTEQVIITGTPASMEDKEHLGQLEPEREAIEIPYYDFLKKTMKSFSKGQYKRSLYRFEQIIASYPDDINANFYGGLCYYNLDDSRKAIACFNLCLEHPYANFQQEAKWYLAKCYLNLKDKEQAKIILLEIVAEDGFYAQAAKKLLPL